MYIICFNRGTNYILYEGCQKCKGEQDQINRLVSKTHQELNLFIKIGTDSYIRALLVSIFCTREKLYKIKIGFINLLMSLKFPFHKEQSYTDRMQN